MNIKKSIHYIVSRRPSLVTYSLDEFSLRNTFYGVVLLTGITIALVLAFQIHGYMSTPAYVRAYRLFHAQEYKRAIRAYRPITEKKSIVSEYALYYLAESYYRMGDYVHAIDAYNQLIKKYPKGLFHEEAEHGVCASYMILKQMSNCSFDQWTHYAAFVYSENRYDELLLLISYLAQQKEYKAEKKYQLLFYEGMAKMWMKDFIGGASALKRASHYQSGYAPAALYYLGKLYRLKDDCKTALYYYQQLQARYPSSTYAIDALFASGICYELLHNYPLAFSCYLQTAQRYPTSSYVDDSYWRIGYFYYRAGNVSKALNYFQRGYTLSPQGDLTPDCIYFAYLCSHKLNQKKIETDLSYKLQTEYPYSFYTFRIREGLSYARNITQPQVLVQQYIPMHINERYDYFMRYQLYEDAARELRMLIKRFPKEEKKRASMLLADLSQRSGEFNYCIEAAFPIVNDMIIKRQYAAIPQEWWYLSFPMAYKKQVIAYGHQYHIDPYFLLAVMREESLCNPTIVSWAGAIGLMQIMPDTGKTLAQKAALYGFNTEMLYTPEVNLHLGAVYLKQLIQRYHNNLYYVLGAYNAGEAAVDRWLAKKSTTEESIDDFIERIPYRETRYYVKRVMGTYFIYKNIYDQKNIKKIK